MKPTENDTGKRRAYRLADVKEAARGRWPLVLQSLGVDAAFLNPRKHTACPACGGRDRYRFTDFKQGGGFICNHCTPEGGSGFDLLMLLHGYTFTEAVDAVAAVLGLSGAGGAGAVPAKVKQAPVTAAADAETEAAARQRLARFWGECRPWNETPLLADYLHGRGIPMPEALPVTADLRFHAQADYWHNGRRLGRFPAMVGVFRAVGGQPCGLHITYLHTGRSGDVGKAVLYEPQSRQRLPAKKMRSVAAGALTGAAIRLFRPENGLLGVCEGIETAFAARYLSGVPMWACGSAHGIQSLVLPERVKDLVIVADNDANGAGMRAARALQRRYQKVLNSIRIWRPDGVGNDALDVLAANVRKGCAA